jgi:hypothetical protein
VIRAEPPSLVANLSFGLLALTLNPSPIAEDGWERDLKKGSFPLLPPGEGVRG